MIFLMNQLKNILLSVLSFFFIIITITKKLLLLKIVNANESKNRTVNMRILSPNILYFQRFYKLIIAKLIFNKTLNIYVKKWEIPVKMCN